MDYRDSDELSDDERTEEIVRWFFEEAISILDKAETEIRENYPRMVG